MPHRREWLYTRGAESVRIEARQDPARPVLVITGPGDRTTTEACATSWDLHKSQMTYEAHLLAQGFALAAGPRRAGRQRRRPAEVIVDD